MPWQNSWKFHQLHQFVVTKLEPGEKINPHKDNKNDGNVPNHTICFGNFECGHLQVERLDRDGNPQWQMIGLTKAWVSFYARSLKHRVTEVKDGARYSVTYYTPGNLDTIPKRRLGLSTKVSRDVPTTARQVGTTETSSTSEQKPVSFGTVVSKVAAPHSEEKGSEGVLKLACSQHVGVRIDQQNQKALPVCRSCSLLDESSRLAGLEALPLTLHELPDGIKALDCLCSSTSAQDSGFAKSYQDVISDRLGLSGVEETNPGGVLARAAVTLYELMTMLKEAGLTNHLPHALVRIHHLQKTLRGVDMKDMAPLIMAPPSWFTS
eukprot:1830052-Amphidinium_carterae.2